MLGRQFRVGDHRRDARFKETRAEHLDEAARRMSVVVEQGQKADEITSDVVAMDLARSC